MMGLPTFKLLERDGKCRRGSSESCSKGGTEIGVKCRFDFTQWTIQDSERDWTPDELVLHQNGRKQSTQEDQ